MALHGIDVSNWQAGLDVGSIPCDFVIAKGTEGINYVDRYCDGFIQSAKSLGKKLGVYHFMTADDPRAQAEFFVHHCGGYAGECILVLDFEADGLRLGSSGAWQFLNRVHELTQVWPLIYMSKSVVHQFDWSEVAKHCGLWVAQYATSGITYGYQDEPWTDESGVEPFLWVMYQYTGNGRLDGYNGALDLDIAYLTPEQWDAYAMGDKAQPQATPTPSTPTTEVVDDKDARALEIGRSVIDLANKLKD